jgi:hypothetical protein
MKAPVRKIEIASKHSYPSMTEMYEMLGGAIAAQGIVNSDG